MNWFKSVKKISVLLAFCVTMASVPVSMLKSAALADTFPDIKGHWCQSVIEKFVKSGWVKGYDDGLFKPDKLIGRAEFTAMVVRILNKIDENAECNFSDVAKTNWFYQEVASSVKEKYIEGYKSGTFNPFKEMSRQEVAVFIQRIMNVDPFKGEIVVKFSDESMFPEWSAYSIKALASHEIIHGYNDGTFKPERLTTRAEAVKMLDIVLKKLNIAVQPEEKVPGVVITSTPTNMPSTTPTTLPSPTSPSHESSSSNNKSSVVNSNTTILPTPSISLSLEAGLDKEVTEGDIVNLISSSIEFSHTSENLKAAVNWNDGIESEIAPITITGNKGAFDKTHVYKDNGQYSVCVSVYGSVYNEVKDSFSVKVKNANPVINPLKCKRSLIGISRQGEVYKIDTKASCLEHIGRTGLEGWTSIAYDSKQHVLFGIAQADTEPKLCEINATSGKASIIASVKLLNSTGNVTLVEGLAYNAKDGYLYTILTDSSDNSLRRFVKIDSKTGIAQEVCQIKNSSSSDTDGLYIVDESFYVSDCITGLNGSATAIYKLDTATGSLTMVKEHKNTLIKTVAFDEMSNVYWGYDYGNKAMLNISKDGSQISANKPVNEDVLEGITSIVPKEACFLTDAYELSLPFSDAGVLDSHSATVNWGDGSVENLKVEEKDGSGTLKASHVYSKVGLYAVSVELTDKDGGIDNYVYDVNVSENMEYKFRPILIFSGNDIGCGWENYASQATNENSFKIGVNMVMYAANGKKSVKMGLLVNNGDWNPDPSALPNLSVQVKERAGIEVTYKDVYLETDDLYTYDFLFITGHQKFTLNEVQKRKLKEYLDLGGVLFVDDCEHTPNNPFYLSFKDLLTELYGKTLTVMPANSPLYHSFYNLNGADFTYPNGLGTEWGQYPLEHMLLDSVSQPLANAGSDQNVTTGQQVTLDGSLSSDPLSKPLNYRWTLANAPENSKAVIVNPESVNPVIIPDVPGVYNIRLVVTNGASESYPDIVTINAVSASSTTP